MRYCSACISRAALLICSLGVLFVAGCSPLELLSVLSSPPRANGASDVVFGPSPELTLNIYGPGDTDSTAGHSRPVIVFFYGGSWQRGDKESYRFVAKQLTSRGFIVVTPDYRRYPLVTFPVFVEDAAAATNWVFENIAEYGGAPENVFLMGHSAGAHIAALTHYDERYLKAVNASHEPCGFIGLAGPYDFLPLSSETLRSVFPEPVRGQSQPIEFVDGSEGPALLMHGLKDDRVKPRNSTGLAEEVRRAGGEANLVLYKKRGHTGVLLALSRTLDFLAPVVDDVKKFVAQHSCAPDRKLPASAVLEY